MAALKSAAPLYERVNNAHHGFMKAFITVHLCFISLAKISMMVYEDHKKLHLRCMSASTMCNTVL